MESGDRSKSHQQSYLIFGSSAIRNYSAFSISKSMASYYFYLKYCFFTILYNKKYKKLSSEYPHIIIVSLLGDTRGLLPQGMLPTLCQKVISQSLEIICKQFPKSIIYHYMNDILLSDSNAGT